MKQRTIRTDNPTYYTIHWYLGRYKKNICTKCGRKGLTHLAKKHNKPHERNFKNYKELCPKCHLAYDWTKIREIQWHNNLAKSPTHRNKIKPKLCKLCKKSYVPSRKSRNYCSNKCSAKDRKFTAKQRDKKGRFLVSIK